MISELHIKSSFTTKITALLLSRGMHSQLKHQIQSKFFTSLKTREAMVFNMIISDANQSCINKLLHMVGELSQYFRLVPMSLPFPI